MAATFTDGAAGRGPAGCNRCALAAGLVFGRPAAGGGAGQDADEQPAKGALKGKAAAGT